MSFTRRRRFTAARRGLTRCVTCSTRRCSSLRRSRRGRRHSTGCRRNTRRRARQARRRRQRTSGQQGQRSEASSSWKYLSWACPSGTRLLRNGGERSGLRPRRRAGGSALFRNEVRGPVSADAGTGGRRLRGRRHGGRRRQDRRLFVGIELRGLRGGNRFTRRLHPDHATAVDRCDGNGRRVGGTGGRRATCGLRGRRARHPGGTLHPHPPPRRRGRQAGEQQDEDSGAEQCHVF